MTTTSGTPVLCRLVDSFVLGENNLRDVFDVRASASYAWIARAVVDTEDRVSLGFCEVLVFDVPALANQARESFFKRIFNDSIRVADTSRMLNSRWDSLAKLFMRGELPNQHGGLAHSVTTRQQMRVALFWSEAFEQRLRRSGVDWDACLAELCSAFTDDVRLLGVFGDFDGKLCESASSERVDTLSASMSRGPVVLDTSQPVCAETAVTIGNTTAASNAVCPVSSLSLSLHEVCSRLAYCPDPASSLRGDDPKAKRHVRKWSISRDGCLYCDSCSGHSCTSAGQS